MLDVGMMEYLRRDAVVNVYSVNLTTSASQIAGSDPMRFAAVFRPDLTLTAIYSFADSVSNPLPIVAPNNTQAQTFTSATLGDYITRAIFGALTSGTTNVVVATMAYNPRMWRIYEQLVRQYLSNSGAL